VPAVSVVVRSVCVPRFPRRDAFDESGGEGCPREPPQRPSDAIACHADFCGISSATAYPRCTVRHGELRGAALHDSGGTTDQREEGGCCWVSWFSSGSARRSLGRPAAVFAAEVSTCLEGSHTVSTYSAKVTWPRGSGRATISPAVKRALRAGKAVWGGGSQFAHHEGTGGGRSLARRLLAAPKTVPSAVSLWSRWLVRALADFARVGCVRVRTEEVRKAALTWGPQTLLIRVVRSGSAERGSGPRPGHRERLRVRPTRLGAARRRW